MVELERLTASEPHLLQEDTEPGVVADLSRLQEPYRAKSSFRELSQGGRKRARQLNATFGEK